LNSIVEHFLKKAGVGISFCIANDTLAKDPIYLADMLVTVVYPAAKRRSEAVGPVMAEGDATCGLALGTDALWITKAPRGFIQKSVPAPGESFGWFSGKWPHQSSMSPDKS